MQLPELTISTMPDMAELAIRSALNLVSVFTVVRIIYAPKMRQRDYMFTFTLFNLIIFITCLLLASARINLGFAFGLFAVFSIMRYRTELIPVKEMGYLFACMSIGILNALVNNDGYYLMPILANVFIIGLLFVLERYTNAETTKEIIYERISLIPPARHAELIEDLKNRTGLPIHRIEIKSIDFLRDIAVITIYYKS